jgi:tRNA A-37 threonylcarbamoyl transferase component Bud32
MAEIDKWIKEQLEKGYKKEQIKEKLLKKRIKN